MNQIQLDRVMRAIGVLFGLAAVLWASGAMAQAEDMPLILPAEVEVRGRGWAQLLELAEIGEFLLAVVETAIMTAALAFHPVNRLHHDPTTVVEIRKGMFIFALIGMMTGFLVVHHGYLIGFVIFGIGGLFRFRMASSSISDTGQMVVVSLIGLAVGLDLPVMALIGAASAWAVIYACGRAQSILLEVKFDKKASIEAAMQTLEAALAEKGFSVLSVKKSTFKPTADYVLSTQLPQAQAALSREMSDLEQRKEIGLAGWHVT